MDIRLTRTVLLDFVLPRIESFVRVVLPTTVPSFPSLIPQDAFPCSWPNSVGAPTLGLAPEGHPRYFLATMIVTLMLLIQVFQHVFLEWFDRSGSFLIHRRFVSRDLPRRCYLAAIWTSITMSSAVMAFTVVYPDNLVL